MLPIYVLQVICLLLVYILLETLTAYLVTYLGNPKQLYERIFYSVGSAT